MHTILLWKLIIFDLRSAYENKFIQVRATTSALNIHRLNPHLKSIQENHIHVCTHTNAFINNISSHTPKSILQLQQRKYVHSLSSELSLFFRCNPTLRQHKVDCCTKCWLLASCCTYVTIYVWIYNIYVYILYWYQLHLARWLTLPLHFTTNGTLMVF